MAEYRLTEVTDHRDTLRFITFPDELYRGCPQYVPALHSDEMFMLTKFAALSYCRRKMWLVLDGGRVAGRICAIINPRYNELYGTRRVRFGWFDCVEDIEVARMLIGAASDWARKEGMTEIHGPLSYNTLGRQGMLVEGYEYVPPFNCPYNYPYYNDFLTALDFDKECDWVQYRMVANHGVPDKTRRVAKMLQDKEKLHFADIRAALQKAKGSLFPFGWAHLFKAKHDYETTDLMANGAVRKWQNTGVSSVFYKEMGDKAIRIGNRWAISNPQLESDSAANIWNCYEHEPYMRRRCYIRNIED